MISLSKEQTGQAFVELALVSGLFLLFLMGILQLIMLASASIHCHETARRAAWHCAISQHLNFPAAQREIQTLLHTSHYTIQEITGTRETGMSVRLSKKVPAIGFFRLFQPDGFEISAQSAVIAYIPEPKAKAIMQQGLSAVWEFLRELSE